MTSNTAKVVLVTGAAKRIGRMIALTFAQRGWDVVVHYGKSASEAKATVADITALGRQAVAVQCDLSNETAVKSLLPQAVKAMGNRKISCVVNNASLFSQDDASNFSHACLDKHIHTNLAAPIHLAGALFDLTPEGEQAVVVNLLDQKLFNMNPDFLSYTLSKAGLQAATTMLAQALAPRIRVAGVAPGITLVSGDQSIDDFAKAHTMTPLRRSSTPEDVAASVCFVAECPAITGTTLLVDGGQHLIPLQRDVMFVAK